MKIHCLPMRRMDRTEWMICFYFVIVIIMTQSVNGTQAAIVSTPPAINYTCDAQGTVNITTSNIKKEQYSRIGVFGLPGSTTCKQQFTNVTTLTGQIHLSKCKLNVPIYVYIMKEQLSGIYGGHEFHEYMVTCNIPGGGVLLTATAKLVNEVTPTPIPEKRTPPLSVTMSISPNTPVVIGQELKIEIRLNDKLPVSIGKLYILPESCSASSGPITGGGPAPAPLKLLSKASAVTLDQELMETFTIADNGSAVTTVYAFRFIESPTIILQCEVRVCMDKSCNETFLNYAYTTPLTQTTTSTTTIKPSTATLTPKPTPAPVAGRRRRAVEQRQTHSQTHVVKAMFSVVEDERKSSGQASIGVCLIGMIGMLLVKPILVLL